jgi:hypothetical protein
VHASSNVYRPLRIAFVQLPKEALKAPPVTLSKEEEEYKNLVRKQRFNKLTDAEQRRFNQLQMTHDKASKVERFAKQNIRGIHTQVQDWNGGVGVTKPATLDVHVHQRYYKVALLLFLEKQARQGRCCLCTGILNLVWCFGNLVRASY